MGGYLVEACFQERKYQEEMPGNEGILDLPTEKEEDRVAFMGGRSSRT